MMNRRTALFLLLAAPLLLPAQHSDTMPEVMIRAYLTDRSVFTVPSSASRLDSLQLARRPGFSLLPPLNSLPGVRMEERSPGSYRLSIRGSLLRSPFGVRNVRIYLDDFPLTDAGGNTYLNLLDPGALSVIEVLRGPDGSLFGVNSGGVVRLGLWPEPAPDSVRIGVTAAIGAWSTFQQQRCADVNRKQHRFLLRDGWTHSDSYRRQARLDRKFLLLGDDWQYGRNTKLRALFFYSRLAYQTPGGLTRQQFAEDPRAARPPSATLPGAEEQHTGVSNNTWFAGLLHAWQFRPRLKHVLAIFSSQSDFRNPFITNYETRNELTGGLRTWLEWDAGESDSWKTYLGYEGAATYSDIRNSDNRYGLPDTLRAHDRLLARQQFVFARLTFSSPHWQLEVGTSLNFNNYRFRSEYPRAIAATTRRFVPQWMPRLAVSRLIGRLFCWRASVSRGYSPPTLAEVRASDNVFNPGLQPESGWSYETGIRFHDPGGFVWVDAAVFYYRLRQAIVRRLDANGEEYFRNAGGTEQPGLEVQLILAPLQERAAGLFRGIQLRSSLFVSRFVFSDYIVGQSDFSGNPLTGVPGNSLSVSADLSFPLRIFLFAEYSYVSSFPLNDANTDRSEPYQLVDLKTGCRLLDRPRIRVDLWAGINNLLDEVYSLGYDLNAAGGRYYNAAPPRNLYAGIKFTF